MTEYARSVQFRPATPITCSAVLAVLMQGGCDRIGTPGVENAADPVVPAAVPPPENMTPVAPRTPEQIIDEFLALPANQRTDDHIRELAGIEAGLDRITEMDLRRSAVSDDGVALLADIEGLAKLDLSGSIVTTAVTEHVARMESLEELRLDEILLEDGSLAALSRLPALKRLTLSSTPISENCFHHLADCEVLESLTLDNNERLLGHGFSQMLDRREFEALRELSVNRTGFGYHGFENLNRLTNLDVLLASDAGVTDPSLDGLRSCTSLRVLKLGGNPLSDAGLERLSRLSRLEHLDVSGCAGISDAALRHLRRHEQLQRLVLEGTRCTEAGARDLKEKFLETTTIVINGGEL